MQLFDLLGEHAATTGDYFIVSLIPLCCCGQPWPWNFGKRAEPQPVHAEDNSIGTIQQYSRDYERSASWCVNVQVTGDDGHFAIEAYAPIDLVTQVYVTVYRPRTIVVTETNTLL